MTEVVKVASPQLGDAEFEAVKRVLESGRYVSGPIVEDFERRWAEFVGVEHAVAVNSGTAALHAALAAMDLRPGEEVVVPALTFFSTVTAVIHQGGVPIFADISLENFCMSPSDLEQRIGPRTRAIIPVHYFGHAANMDPIMDLAATNELVVVEDAAQAHGTTFRGRCVGSIGHFGAFSFFATKHMTTGEGGAVTTNNADHATFMRRFRSHGLVGRHHHELLGYNYRMTEMAAAIGLVQLEKLPALNDARIKNSENLLDQIRDIPWLTLPRVPDHIRHTYFWCHVVIDEERLGRSTSELIEALRERGIETRNRYLAPLNEQPLLSRSIPPILRAVAGDNLPDYESVGVPNASKVAGKVIGLPNRPDMSRAEIRRVADVLHQL